MNTKQLKKEMLKYILPSMFAMMLSGFYSIVDGLFVGNAAGNDALGAINMVWPLQCILNAVAIGTGVGSAVLMSTYKGEEREHEAKNIWGMGMVLLLIAGIVLPMLMLVFLSPLLSFLGAEGSMDRLCRQYIIVILVGGIFPVLGNGLNPLIRNMGNTVSATILMSSGLVTNIVLDYFLVYKYDMGLYGAGLATIIAQAVVACCSVGYLFMTSRALFHAHYFKMKSIEVKKIMKIGISPFGQSLVPSLTILFTNWKCIQYGGSHAVTIFSVVTYILSTIQLLLQGIGDGVQPLFSFYYGARKKQELSWLYKHAFVLSFLFSSICTILVIRYAGNLSDLFGITMELREGCMTAIILSSFAFITLGLARLTCSYFYATGKPLISTILVYIEPCLLLPFFLNVMARFYKLNGVWMAGPLVQLTLCAAALFMKQFLSKKEKV